MRTSSHTIIRRTGFVLVAAVLGAVITGSALAGTQSGLNLPPAAAIKASSGNWAAKGRLLDINGQPLINRFAPTAATREAGANWAAKAKLLDVNGQPFSQGAVSSKSGTTFDWGDFGIGAGAMLGLLLLGIGLAAGAHYGRRSSVSTRTA